jgi:broad specificity phosphatase PhoE
VQKIIQGQQGGELTELGFQQSWSFGDSLKTERFDDIFHWPEPLPADLIATDPLHSYVSPVFDERLREKAMGTVRTAAWNDWCFSKEKQQIVSICAGRVMNRRPGKGKELFNGPF